jgi:hypothetical protein
MNLGTMDTVLPACGFFGSSTLKIRGGGRDLGPNFRRSMAKKRPKPYEPGTKPSIRNKGTGILTMILVKKLVCLGKILTKNTFQEAE